MLVHSRPSDVSKHTTMRGTIPHYPFASRFIFLWILVLCIVLVEVWAFEACESGAGGGVCPSSNTCCLMANNQTGCIPSDMGARNATCCMDGSTGCPVGYACREKFDDCLRVDPSGDPLARRLPRYRLCHLDEAQTKVQGFPYLKVPGVELAVLASHPDIFSDDQFADGPIDFLVFVLHGANRNADDYLCSVLPAIDVQPIYQNVLVVAPIFYSESDEREKFQFLFWDNTRDGSWRYGADSLGPQSVSSFGAFDEMISFLMAKIPNVPVTICGHSSGGQFVQRWTLLTKVWDYTRIHSVIMNPSSYCYLSPFRKIKGTWQIPLPQYSCHGLYDSWEWGLEEGGPYFVPYRRFVNRTTANIVNHYRRRDVSYIVGGLDRCNVSEAQGGWCDSHGLETSCMDSLQGGNRFERGLNFFESIQEIGTLSQHRLATVSGVGHNHSAMFQSPVGVRHIFQLPEDDDLVALD